MGELVNQRRKTKYCGKSGVGDGKTGTRVLAHSESVLQCHTSGLETQTRHIR